MVRIGDVKQIAQYDIISWVILRLIEYNYECACSRPEHKNS